VLVLAKPPYLRWLAAASLVLGAVAWEFSERSTEPVAFASRTIERGASIEPAAFVWRQVPSGLMTSFDPTGSTATVVIATGDPIIAGAVTGGLVVPKDWWTVPAQVPLGAVRGSAVRVVLSDGYGVSGLVVEPSRDDSFGIRADGLIAVPSGAADAVALAAASGDLIILFEP